MYGYDKLAQPIQINIDWSMASIKAILHSFNNEHLMTYVNRAVDIVSGIANENDFQKTVIRVCLSHFMHRISKRCSEICNKKNAQFCMRLVSLLAMCKTLAEIEELINDAGIVLSSKYVTDLCQNAYGHVISKINSFQTMNTRMPDVHRLFNDSEQNPSPTKIKYRQFEESEGMARLANSKFDIWAKTILAKVQNDVSKCETREGPGLYKNPLNDHFKPEFLNLLTKQYFPNIPIWGDLLIGDLKRHSKNYDLMKHPLDSIPDDDIFRSAHQPTKLTAIAEARFNVIKNVDLNGQSQSRMDDFIGILCDSWKGIYKIVAEGLLKTGTLRKNAKEKETRGKTKIDLEEGWDKKQTQPFQLQKIKENFNNRQNFLSHSLLRHKNLSKKKKKLCTTKIKINLITAQMPRQSKALKKLWILLIFYQRK